MEEELSISVPTPVVVNVSESVSSEQIPDTCCGKYEEPGDSLEKWKPGERVVRDLTFDNRDDGK